MVRIELTLRYGSRGASALVHSRNITTECWQCVAEILRPASQVANVGGIRITRTGRHEIDYHYGTFTHHDTFTWTDESGRDRVAMKTHRMALASYPELAYFLEDTGFERICTFNSYEDRVPDKLTGQKILGAAKAPSARARDF